MHGHLHQQSFGQTGSIQVSDDETTSGAFPKAAYYLQRGGAGWQPKSDILLGSTWKSKIDVMTKGSS